MPILIKKVTDNELLKKFVRFPFELYKNNPYWIPPLMFMELRELRYLQSPSYTQADLSYFIAIRHDKIVGRIGAIHHISAAVDKSKGRFGWFETINDLPVASRLLQTAEKWLQERGKKHIEGPLGCTNLDKAGCLIEGFDQLSNITTLYNHPYYEHLILQNGYTPSTDWLEYRIAVPPSTPERLNRFADIVANRLGLHILKNKTKKDVFHYANALFELMNKTHKHLHGYIPLDRDQIKYYIEKFGSFLQPDYTSIILDPQDRLVAFGIALPSMSRAFQKANGRLYPLGWWHIKQAIKKNDTADLMLIGVDPAYQKKGVPALIFYDFSKGLINNNIQWLESNPELETNKNVQVLWAKYDYIQHKKRRSFIKNL